MATPDQIPTDLTLEIGDGVKPDQFMAAARAFFGYVEEIAKAISPADEVLTWTVKVREGSSLLAVEAVPSAPAEIVQFVYVQAERGVRTVASGNVEDAGLTEGALRHLRTLSELTEGPRSAPLPVKIWIKKKPIQVDPTIAQAIREEWREDYRDYGTVEGRLKAIEDQGSLRLLVRDPLLGQAIRAYFPEALLQDAFASFRKRVEVTGLIHYRRNGTPISIDASHIAALPDDDELPSPEEVRGLLRAVG